VYKATTFRVSDLLVHIGPNPLKHGVPRAWVSLDQEALLSKSLSRLIILCPRYAHVDSMRLAGKFSGEVEDFRKAESLLRRP